ncbi:outer membrane beta-barrel protein [Sphingobium boeckii]|nr:outer membrane beta-barrel protein [Sphingobium boeckii]
MASAMCLLAPATPALAQYLDPLPSRFPRDRNVDTLVPGYEAPGVPLGPFIMTPSLAASALYSDNIYAQEANATDDVALRIAPSVKLQSIWPVNKVAVNLTGQFDRFSTLKRENAERFDADVTTLLELSSDTIVRSRLRWQRLQEPRSSQNAFVQTLEPIRYDMTSSAIGLSHDLNRIRLTGEAAAIKTNYFNGRLQDGTALDTRGRDSTALTLRGRIEYAQMPGLSYFLQGTYNDRDFRPSLSATPQRDSTGYEVLAGVSFEPSALMRGEIGIGYLAQNFKDPFFHDYGNLGVRGRLQYYPTRLTTITLEADRRVEDSGTPLSGAYLSTSLSIKAEHALLRTLIVTASADYQADRFNDVDRDDDRYALGLRAEYQANRVLSFSASASHLNVTSDGLDRYRNFSENRFMAGISIRR